MSQFLKGKMKKLKGKIVKYNGNDKYTFIGGVDIVPGCRLQGKRMKITLKEFNTLKTLKNKGGGIDE